MKQPLKTGFPRLDAYGEARKEVAYASFDDFYRRVKFERKKRIDKLNAAGYGEVDEADMAAKDAVTCLEYAMIAVAGEKCVYKTIVAPALLVANANEGEDDEGQMSPYFRKACVAAYAYIVGSVVDRVLDIIETVFLKECGIGTTSGNKSGEGGSMTVRTAAAAAAAGLRILDGVRMLGPSLAKLGEMQVGDGTTDASTSIAATLCIAIHRTTVKNTAKTLEKLAKAIQDDPFKGAFHRPKDASVSSVSRNVVYAIIRVSPFVGAYKSVAKRRALPWDPNMGEDAGELDSFVRYLVMRLLNSLKGEITFFKIVMYFGETMSDLFDILFEQARLAINYTKEGRSDGQAKSNFFMINNAYFVLRELGPDSAHAETKDKEHYRIEGNWFLDKINKIIDAEKTKYLGHWETLNGHLTAVANDQLEYMENSVLHECQACNHPGC